MTNLIHGRASTYNNHKCRCEECKAAWREYIVPRMQAWRKGEAYSTREPGYITLSERYAKLLRYQNGVCAICKTKPNGKKLAVDHDHKTNRTRGLLCSNCNTAIGMLRDDIQFLKNAIDYLESPPNQGAKIYL